MRAAVLLHVRPFVHHQERDANHAHHVQAENDDDDAADLRDQRAMCDEQRRRSRWPSSRAHEDAAESGDERDGVSERLRPRRRRGLRLEIFETLAGQQRKVGRNERKDARRYEGNEARQEGDAGGNMRRRGHAPEMVILPSE